MKIIHIGWYKKKPVGGVGKTILEQTKSLCKIGHSVEIWCIAPHVNKPTLFDEDTHCPVWLLPRRKQRLLAALGFPAATRSWIESRLEGIDCFHLHSVFTPNNNLVGCLGKPYVITPNGGWEDEVLGGRNRFVKKLWILLKEQKTWNRASFVQAVSLPELENLNRNLKIPRVVHIPNGAEIPPTVSPLDERDILLFMGRFAVQQKGLDRLMPAILELKRRNENFPKIVMVGPDFRGGQQYLKDFVYTHRLEKEVEVRGPIQDAEKELLFRRARLFLHTSRWEGLPLVLLEAIAHGIPCVLTKGTNVAEEWQQKGCALLVNDNPESIAKGILQMLSSDLEAFSCNARDLAERDYSWEVIGKRLSDLYEQACRG